MLHDLGANVTLFNFEHSNAVPVTALSFRNDGPQVLFFRCGLSDVCRVVT